MLLNTSHNPHSASSTNNCQGSHRSTIVRDLTTQQLSGVSLLNNDGQGSHQSIIVRDLIIQQVSGILSLNNCQESHQ